LAIAYPSDKHLVLQSLAVVPTRQAKKLNQVIETKAWAFPFVASWLLARAFKPLSPSLSLFQLKMEELWSDTNSWFVWFGLATRAS